jgi:hypothetical protein
LRAVGAEDVDVQLGQGATELCRAPSPPAASLAFTRKMLCLSL